MKKLLLSLFVVATATFGMAQVTDGSFEGGAGAGFWTEASTNFGTPLCDANCGTCGGPCVPNNGSWYVWFGGAQGAEVGSVEQSVTIPNGSTATFNMLVKIAVAADSPDDKLEISVDGNVLQTITGQDSTSYTDYALVSINVDALADGGAHTLRLEGTQASASFNILVDDVFLQVDGQTVVGLFDEPKLADVTIYPNPATEAINLQFGNIHGEANVSITTMDGKLVAEETLTDVSVKLYQLGTENLQNGVYIVTVTNGDSITTQQISVVK